MMEIQQVINDSLNVFSIDSRGVILECSKFFGNHPENLLLRSSAHSRVYSRLQCCQDSSVLYNSETN
jgi:hypothetical protein